MRTFEKEVAESLAKEDRNRGNQTIAVPVLSGAYPNEYFLTNVHLALGDAQTEAQMLGGERRERMFVVKIPDAYIVLTDEEYIAVIGVGHSDMIVSEH